MYDLDEKIYTFCAKTLGQTTRVCVEILDCSNYDNPVRVRKKFILYIWMVHSKLCEI